MDVDVDVAAAQFSVVCLVCFSAVCFGKRLLSSSFDVNALGIDVYKNITSLQYAMEWQASRARVYSISSYTNRILNVFRNNLYLDRDVRTIQYFFVVFFLFRQFC